MTPSDADRAQKERGAYAREKEGKAQGRWGGAGKGKERGREMMLYLAQVKG